MSLQQDTSPVKTTSPARVTRIQEKDELAHLNDRFLHYIDQVRSMKETNLRLELELCNTKDQLGRESESVKSIYEAELVDARNLIDETAKEKARQQIIASKNAARIEELEAEVKDLKDTVDRLETRTQAAERNATSLDAQRKSALFDKNKLQKQVSDLEAELADLRGACDSMKSSLESETLSKVDLQNHIQSLKEEMAFRQKIHDEELAGLRNKMSVSASVIYETDIQGQLDSRLEGAIDELRERSDFDLADFKQQIEAVYQDKLTALENQSIRDSSTINKLNIDLRNITASLSDQGRDIAKLQKANEHLEAVLREKDDELNRIRRQHSDDMSRRLDELRQLRENYESKIQEYEQLMDVKVQLDQEIATYRALLMEEETRLSMTPTPREKRTRTRTQTGVSTSKKPRLDTSLTQKSTISSSASGCIQIIEVDSAGRYVMIKNESDSIESIGGFKILQEVDNGKEVSFRFHNKSKLQGGASVAVWGNEADGAIHNPPSDVIWRAQGSWGTGNKIVTKLSDKTGNVIATFTQTIEVSPSKSRPEPATNTGLLDSSTRSFPHIPDNDTVERDSSSPRSGRMNPNTRYPSSSSHGGMEQQRQVGNEDMFHQKGDPHAPEKQNCVVS